MAEELWKWLRMKTGECIPWRCLYFVNGANVTTVKGYRIYINDFPALYNSCTVIESQISISVFSITHESCRKNIRLTSFYCNDTTLECDLLFLISSSSNCIFFGLVQMQGSSGFSWSNEVTVPWWSCSVRCVALFQGVDLELLAIDPQVSHPSDQLRSPGKQGEVRI